MARSKFRVAVVCMALAAGAWAVIGSAWLLPELSANSDEGIYLLQVQTLTEGRLSPPAPDTHPEAFVPWFSRIHDGHYSLKYTPVHASIIAVASLGLTVPRLALGVLAALVVVTLSVLARELRLTRPVTLVGVGLFTVSPLMLQLSITYLPYSTGLLLAAFTAICALRSTRNRGRAWALFGGLSWGLLFFARPFDAVLWLAIIVAGTAAATSWSALRRAGPDFVIGSIFPLVVMLGTNQAVTGDPFQLPFNFLEPLDRLGFGERRSVPNDPLIDYGPGEALRALGRNLVLVVGWAGGGAVTIALGGWALFRRLVPNRTFFIAMLVVWPLGYAYFWGSYVSVFVWDGGLFLGPYYYVPVVLAFSLAGAVGLVSLLENHRVAGLMSVAGGLVLTMLLAIPTLADQGDRSTQRSEIAALIDDEATTPALVLIPPVYGPYLQNPFAFLRNSPTIDGDTVFALEGTAERDLAILAMYPDRNAFRLVLDNGWSDKPGFEPDARLETIDRQPSPVE